jgi:carbon starvation protein CstA
MNLNSFLAGLGFHPPLSAATRPLSGYHWELVFALVQAMSIFPMVAYLYCKSPASWGHLVYTGDIKTIWPLFGMSNQLLATCGLIVGTTMSPQVARPGPSPRAG